MDPIVKPAPSKRGDAIRRRIVAFFGVMVALVLFAGQAASSTPAQAGEGCDNSKGLICGRVKNDQWSSRTVNVHDHWDGKDAAGNYYSLQSGNWSRYKDTDAYCVPPDTEAYVFIYGPLTKEKWWDAMAKVSYGKSNDWRCRKISDSQMAIYFGFIPPRERSARQPMTSSSAKLTQSQMLAKAKQEVKKRATSVCKAAKKTAKNQKSKYYKKYKKTFGYCAKNFGVKVPKK